jgi:hypothetical protein
MIDPFEDRCGHCGAALVASDRVPAPEFCGAVCEAEQVMRRARRRHLLGELRKWIADRLRWLVR